MPSRGWNPTNRPWSANAAMKRSGLASTTLRGIVRGMGCGPSEPFVQTTFPPRSVIPHLEITDRGLIDVDRFEVVGLDR